MKLRTSDYTQKLKLTKQTHECPEKKKEILKNKPFNSLERKTALEPLFSIGVEAMIRGSPYMAKERGWGSVGRMDGWVEGGMVD